MSRRNQLILGSIAVAALNLAFLLSFWNRFLAPSVSGVFLEFAARWTQGLMPYRDFFVIITPLYIWKTAALMALFGHQILWLRLVEVITRCILGVLLFLWLARVVRIPHAFLGALSAIFLFSSDPADSLISYQQESVLWAFVAGLLLACMRKGRGTRNALLVLGSGLCCSLSFLTKQTTGAGITLALAFAIVVLAWREEGAGKAAKKLVFFGVGWAVPAAGLVVWLKANGALGAFVKAIFLTGPSAKGSKVAILLRVIADGWARPTRPDLVAAILCAIVALVLIARRRQRAESGTRSMAEMAIALLVCAIAVALGFAIAQRGVRLHGAFRLEDFSIRLGLFGSTAFAAYYTCLGLRRDLTEDERQRWLLSLTGFSIAYMLGLSWSAYGPMAFPSAGIVLAFGLEALWVRRKAAVLRYAGIAGTAAILLSVEYGHQQLPFGWVNWNDPPVRTATVPSRLPMLKGLILNPQVESFTERLTGLIDANSLPGQSVFIYPYQPLFYLLANRWPPTFAQVHYFDVAPDAICRRDANTLVHAKPAVIVDFSEPEELKEGEQEFRNGAPSGQRELYQRMYAMIRTQYHLASVLQNPGGPEKVKVFVLNPQTQ